MIHSLNQEAAAQHEEQSTPSLKVLCISFWTPPEVRPQAILLEKMLPEWIRQGVSPVLLTIARKDRWSIEIPQYYIPNVSGILARIPALRAFNNRIYLWHWTHRARKIIKEHHVDVIFSFANPQECNMLGAALHKMTGVPFVSHFSDPWYDNHYKDFSPEQADEVFRMERDIIEHSDCVIFTNQPALELVMKKYPLEWTEKSAVIPHCFDVHDYLPRSVLRKTAPPYLLSYIGVFYQLRTPEPFFKALNQLIKKRPDLRGSFRIELIGAVNPYAGYSAELIESQLDTYGLKGMAQIIPTMSYRESLKRMCDSDLLVVVDADIPGSPYLPSKVVDYIGSGTDCVGITPKGSPTAKTLQGSGYWSFAYNETDQIVHFLELWLSAKIIPERNDVFIKEFEVASTTSKLISHLKEVTHRQ